jgi:tRNA 2-thiouridine synthesizing protein A
VEEQSIEIADIWDAGAMGCGELIIHLRGRVRALPPGGVLRLIAHDPGVIEDLPAWCRLTGHSLVAAEHPVYHIRRKEA